MRCLKVSNLLRVLTLSIALSNSALAGNNILLIIADDFGIDSLSLYNTNAAATFPPTPNLNSLASQGVLFRNAYSYPTCSPTRSAILTGRYGFRTGIGAAIVPPNDPQLPSSELTIPEVLGVSAQDVRRASFGKWHLGFNPGTPNTLGGWSHFSGAIQGAVQDYSSWQKVVNGTTFPGYSVYATSDNVNDASAWMGQQGTTNWFAWLAFNAGHTPYHKPPNALHSYDSLPGTELHIRNNPRLYYEAMIEAMDTEIGRLLSNISLTNTTVIFVGDNGTPGQVIQSPYNSTRAKGTLYEGGIRVPLIIAGAVVSNPGRSNDTLVHCVDLFSTILELAGVNVALATTNRAIASMSLMPILNGTTTNISRTILSENFSETLSDAVAGRALRSSGYKLIQFQSGTNELYDLQVDPTEATNLLGSALTPDQQRAYDALLAQSDQWQARPHLNSPQKTGSRLSISFTPVQRYSYTLQRSTSLTAIDWTSITNLVAASSDAAVQLTDFNPALNIGFYRVQSSIP